MNRKAIGVLVFLAIAAIFVFVSLTSNYDLVNFTPEVRHAPSYIWNEHPYQYFPLVSNMFARYYSMVIVVTLLSVAIAAGVVWSLVQIFDEPPLSPAPEKKK